MSELGHGSNLWFYCQASLWSRSPPLSQALWWLFTYTEWKRAFEGRISEALMIQLWHIVDELYCHPATYWWFYCIRAMAMLTHVPNVEGVAEVDWKSKREVLMKNKVHFLTVSVLSLWFVGTCQCWLNKHTSPLRACIALFWLLIGLPESDPTSGH